MENLTHSLSKKSYGGFGMASHKSVYDDVFGGPPKFGVTTLAPRFEDYTEIFGGFHSSRGSSIPILDLPVVEEVEMAFDVRSSRLEDYSEVFGGFDGFDFAVSFEDLVMRKSNGGDDSSDDAWSPVQSESISDESDLFAYSERSQGLLNTDAHHQFGDVRQLNVSDHNVNQKTNEKLSNRVAHVGQVHAIPGHAYMVNEAHASPIIEYEGPPLQAGDLNSKAEFLGRIVEKRCFKESISLPKNSGIIATESDTHHVESSESAFAQKKPFVTVNDISLRTRPSWLPPPSRPPPVFAVRTREPEKPYSKLRALNSYAFERMAGEGSPPFYDVEIDASSSKVASEAMEVAKEKTQAKTRKESMETKDVLQSHLKLQARDIIKSVDEMINKASNSCKDDIVLETFARGGNEIQSTAQEMKTVTKGTQEASDLIDQEKCIDLVENPTHRRHTKESLSQVSHKPTGSFAWRQESEYFEVAETDISLKAVEQFEDDKSHVLQSIGSEEYIHASKTATGESPRQEVIKEVKAEAPKLEETRNELEIKEHTCEWDVNSGRSNKTMESSCQKENQKNAEVDFNACESEMGKKRLKRDKQHGDKTIEKDADKSVRNAEKAVRHVAEVEFKGKLNGFSERTDSYKVINDVHAKKANERRQRECFLHEEYYKNPGEAVERVQDVKWKIQQEDRKWQEESSEREGNEQKQKEVYQSMENLVILEEVIEQEDRAERFSSAIQYKEGENDFQNCEQEDEERHQNPDCEIEEKKRSVLETHDLVEDEKQFDVACETGELDARLTDFCKLESGKDGSMVVNEKEDTEENARLTRVLEGSVDTSQSTIKNEEMIEQSELANPIKWDGNDRMVNLDQGIYEPQKGWNINSLNGEYELKDNMHETLEATQAANLCEDDKKLKTEFKDGEGGLDLRTPKLTGEEISLSYGRNQHDKYKIHMEHATESHCLHDHVVDSDGAGTGIGNSANKQDDKVSQLENDLEKKRGNAHERGKRGKLTNGVQVTFSEEILKEKSRTRPISEELSESEKKTGAAIPSVLNDRKNSFNTCQRGTICNAETKGRRVNVALTPEERKIKQRLHQERELENEHIRRIEEERDRAREREKDRMAVDKAALEARERSYAEAREGAERAVIGRTTAEVRQRAGMEGRGRLDMESMEARIRAERAAVERATAEARQRAFEKTMTAKASFESRERVERSVPDQLYAYSRNAEMRRSSFSDPPDLQTQSSGTSNVFHYSYSSVNAGVEGESPQRCKARLERYRRTAERAAKALAEKNMRDLFAQREQTERTRLAEPLDAEVRRWSSGKEGNLRALLSTLQYILGPDSGWQPIPLTEVITTVAVKKAYRKATLCVHPDKLQQRGASIQQKYICEKVFDLLKEAWNTFNSEER